MTSIEPKYSVTEAQQLLSTSKEPLRNEVARLTKELFESPSSSFFHELSEARLALSALLTLRKLGKLYKDCMFGKSAEGSRVALIIAEEYMEPTLGFRLFARVFDRSLFQGVLKVILVASVVLTIVGAGTASPAWAIGSLAVGALALMLFSHYRYTLRSDPITIKLKKDFEDNKMLCDYFQPPIN